jgi:hypothetical protein
MTFDEFVLTRDTMPILLMALLGLLFMLLGKGDPSTVPNVEKKLVAVIAGIFLGILFMFYNKALDPTLEISIVTLVKYLFGGLMMGANAIGLDQLMKGGMTKEPDEPVVNIEKKTP